MKKIMFFWFLIIFSATAFATGVKEGAASADVKWPTRQVSIVVGAKPGGGSDATARLYGKYFEKVTGGQFPIVNIEGGGSSVASTQVKNSKPDGYMMLSQNESMIANKLSETVNYSYESFDIVGIGLFTKSVALIGNGKNFKTYEEMQSYAKTNPGKLIASNETGTIGDQAFAALQEGLGVNIQIADGGSVADRLATVLGKHADVFIAPIGNVKDYLENGDLCVLFVFNDKRLNKYPNVPTSLECGVDYLYDKFFVLAMPKGIDSAIHLKAQDILEKIVQDPEFVAEAEQLELVPEFLNSMDSVKYLEVSEQRMKTYADKYGNL